MPEKWFSKTFLIVFCLIFSLSAESSDFYVSPEGNDGWTGTESKPFKTLDRARTAVRAKISGGMDADIVVMLRGGTHLIDKTVVFGIADSAKDGLKIVYRNYPGEEPVISSGVAITGWRKAEIKGNVWVADVPKSLGLFRTLYQGDTMLPRARAKGFTPVPETPLDNTTHPFYTNRRDVMRFSETAGLRDWDNLGDIELIVRPSRPWLMNILPLESVDVEKGIATTGLEATYPIYPIKNHGDEETVWVENVIEGLDEPGEWVVNTKTGKLYLWPVDDKPGDDIVAPALREYIRVEGEGVEKYWEPDKKNDVPVRGIHFSGLTFTHGDRGIWRENDAGIQHDWEMVDTDNAIIRFRGAEDCAVEECHFYNTGGNAIRMDLYAQRIAVRNSHFHDLGQSAVVMIGYGPGTKDVNKDNVVENNHIHHNGLLYWHSQQVIAWQSGGNRIAHNYFHDLPRKAVCISGVRERFFVIARDNGMAEPYKRWRECGRSIRWFELDLPDTTYESLAPYLHARNNVVEYNKAVNCSLMLGDGAVINCSGAGSGNVFRYNYVEDVNNGSALMRADDDQKDMLWEGNILVAVKEGQEGSAIISKGGNTLRNNIVVANIRQFKGWPMNGCVFEKNIYYAPAGKEPELLGKFFQDMGSRQDVKMDYNVYYHAGGSSVKDDATLKQVRSLGYDKHSLYDVDPMFEDWKNGDFRLKPGSLALKLGFKQIPFDKIGLKPDFPTKFK
jgi:hypothetical protein